MQTLQHSQAPLQAPEKPLKWGTWHKERSGEAKKGSGGGKRTSRSGGGRRNTFSSAPPRFTLLDVPRAETYVHAGVKSKGHYSHFNQFNVISRFYYFIIILVIFILIITFVEHILKTTRVAKVLHRGTYNNNPNSWITNTTQASAQNKQTGSRQSASSSAMLFIYIRAPLHRDAPGERLLLPVWRLD